MTKKAMNYSDVLYSALVEGTYANVNVDEERQSKKKKNDVGSPIHTFWISNGDIISQRVCRLSTICYLLYLWRHNIRTHENELTSDYGL